MCLFLLLASPSAVNPYAEPLALVKVLSYADVFQILTSGRGYALEIPILPF